MSRSTPPRVLRLRAVVVAAAAAALLAGCGSTPSDGDAATAPSTTGSSASADPSAATMQQSTATVATSPAAAIGSDGCITDFTAGVDYFPDKVTIDDAKNLTVAYHDSYVVVTVAEPSPKAPAESYVLVRCGAPTPKLPADLAGAQQVTVPVSSLFSGSTTQLPALVMLDRLDTLTGVASKALISEKQVLDRVASPDVVEFADASMAIDAETVVAAKPGVLITGGMDDPAYAKIEKAGIPVIADADWLETSPLGRAEWMKLFAVLTDSAAAGQKVFDSIAADYRATAAKVAEATPVPVVWGAPFNGDWYVPGGASYAAKLIADAGATYPWSGNKQTGSIPSNVETVFAKSGTAPLWLANTTWTERADIGAQNRALTEFTAFKDGNVWNAVKDVNAAGANNYYELGAARPDMVLADLAAIVHPDKMPGHDFAFYVKLH